MVNDYHILAMDLATREELDKIAQMSFQINQIMVDFFKTVKVDLIDFKLEFGKTSDGTIILGRRDLSRHLPLLGQATPMRSWIRTVSAGIWRRGRAYEEMMRRLGLRK